MTDLTGTLTDVTGTTLTDLTGTLTDVTGTTLTDLTGTLTDVTGTTLTDLTGMLTDVTGTTLTDVLGGQPSTSPGSTSPQAGSRTEPFSRQALEIGVPAGNAAPATAPVQTPATTAAPKDPSNHPGGNILGRIDTQRAERLRRRTVHLQAGVGRRHQLAGAVPRARQPERLRGGSLGSAGPSAVGGFGAAGSGIAFSTLFGLLLASLAAVALQCSTRLRLVPAQLRPFRLRGRHRAACLSLNWA